MSDLVLDASLAVQWFLQDETDRSYSLNVLGSLSRKRAAVPILWFYEVGNALVMACRRNRVTGDRVQEFLLRLRSLPIDAAQQAPAVILGLPKFAMVCGLTNYDAAYLALALESRIPLATTDHALRAAAASARVSIFVP